MASAPNEQSWIESARVGNQLAFARLVESGSLGSSSETARRRAESDEIERLVQVITDQIILGAGA